MQLPGRVINSFLGLALICFCTSMEASGLVDGAFSGCAQSGVGTRAQAFARCPIDLLSESGAAGGPTPSDYSASSNVKSSDQSGLGEANRLGTGSGEAAQGVKPIVGRKCLTWSKAKCLTIDGKKVDCSEDPEIVKYAAAKKSNLNAVKRAWFDQWKQTKTGSAPNGSHKCLKCSPECRTEHNRGSRKHAACDLPDFSPEGMKRIMKYSYAKRTKYAQRMKRQHGCATVSKKRGWRESHSCTSCQPGRTLFITWNLLRTGHCHGGNRIHQECTALDSNSGGANGMANSLCTKRAASSMKMWIRRGLKRTGKKGSAVWKHFRPLFGGYGIIQVFYVVQKYVACRGGSCATNKVVTCTKVCPTHLPQSRCSSKYCKEPFGSFIVREVAMLT